MATINTTNITRETVSEDFGKYTVYVDTQHVDFADDTYKVTAMVWNNETSEMVHVGNKNYGSVYAAFAAMAKKYGFDY